MLSLNENIRMWVERCSESEGTRRVYEYAIYNFVEFCREVFREEIDSWKEQYRDARYSSEREKDKFLDKIKDIFESYMCELKKMDYAPTVRAHARYVIMSYLKKGCGIKDLDVEPVKHVSATYHNRDITKEEIQKVVQHAGLRDKVFFLMMAESGLRPNTLAQLRYSHVKQEYEANKVPMKIELPSSLLKDRISSRFTFVGEDACMYLREYLSTRGKLKDDDLLFAPTRPTRQTREYVSAESFSGIFNKLIQKLALATPRTHGKPKELRLYCLRKYFFKNMRCDSVYRNYWFCHSSIDDHYISTNDVERHREEYLKGYPSLRVFEPTESTQVEDLRVDLATAYKTIGELQQELEKTKKTSLTSDDLMELFRDTLPTEIFAKLANKIAEKKTLMWTGDTIKSISSDKNICLEKKKTQ